MAKARRKRTQYSAGQRREVLAAAVKEKLTAAQVQKRFGVKPVTYYSWRKKTGVAKARGGRKGRRPSIVAGSPNLANTLRSEIQKLDAEAPVYSVATLEERMTEQVADTRSYSLLLGLFAGLGTVLATTVVGELGNPKDYHSQKAYAKAIPQIAKEKLAQSAQTEDEQRKKFMEDIEKWAASGDNQGK